MNGISSSIAPVAKRLKGKVAIITGGASGFGETTARLFTKHGAKVIIADVQDDKGISLCNDILLSSTTTAAAASKTTATTDDEGETPPIISYVHCDVSDETQVKNLVNEAVSRHGKLDVMFNNAGIPGDVDPTLAGTTVDNFKKLMEVNVLGGFMGAKHAARVMTPRKSGVILFTSSLASLVAGEAPHGYTVSKHAIIGLMKNVCVEMGQHGVRVNAISPCSVATPLLYNALGMDKESIDGVICESAVLKGVAPEALDVANAALFLASDEAKFVSGVNFVIDGGYSATNPSFSMALNNKLLGSSS